MTAPRSNPIWRVGQSDRKDLPLAVIVGAGGMAMGSARRLGQTHRLLLADRNADHLAAQVDMLRFEGHDTAGCVCDVSRRQDVEALAAQAATLGPIMAIAHVVGLSSSMADFRTIMAVNLIGATLVERTFLPLVAPQASAVFVSSIAGHRVIEQDVTLALDEPLADGFLDRIVAMVGGDPVPRLAYQLSKNALMRMVERRAGEWGRRGARINSVSPGLIATPMGAFEFSNNPFKYELVEQTPIQREGTLVEITDAIDFLLSPRASFISGIDLRVDGGLISAQRHASQ